MLFLPYLISGESSFKMAGFVIVNTEEIMSVNNHKIVYQMIHNFSTLFIIVFLFKVKYKVDISSIKIHLPVL